MITPTRCPHVAIVILNWNGYDDTIACLESLGRQEYPSYDIVVVDNGSADGSPEAIRGRFPNITLIENGRNLGFAAGSNVGIAHAMQRGADCVLLLNNDTEVSSDLVQSLIDVAESDPRIGILGPKIYYYDRPDVIWSAGGAIGKSGEASHLRADQADDFGPEAVRDVDYVTGCAMLVKRRVVEVAGVLDERFFAYFEEAEWCTRARKRGFRIVYVPQARMWHKLQPEQRTRSRRYLYLMTRNRLLYLRCSSAGPAAILAAMLDLLRTAASWSFRPQHRDMRPYAGPLVRGVCDFLLGRFGMPYGLS